MSKDPGGLFTFLIIAVMVSIGIIKNILEQKARKRGLGSSQPSGMDDWQEWESGTASTPQTTTAAGPAVTPSSRVQQILGALEEAQRKQTMARAASLPQPAVVPAPAPVPAEPTAQQPSPGESKTRRYLDDKGLTRLASSIGDADSPGKTSQKPFTKSMSTAYPDAARLARKQQAGTRKPILLRGIDRQALRRAVLMTEVLARPRAFDV